MSPAQDVRDVRTEAQEAALLAGLRAGREEAFEELIRAHGPHLLCVARKLLSSEDDAQDALQEAFLSAFKSIAGFQGGARLSTWLHRIVVNASLMKRRTQSRRREQDIESLMPRFSEGGHHAEPPSSWQESADAPAQRQETCELVRSCIDQLPDSYREALILRDIEELETEEVARHLGVSVNAAKIRVHRARQALRTLLDPHMQGGGA